MPRSRRTSKLFPALAGAGVLAALSLVAITQGDEAAATGSGHAGSGRHGARVVSPLPAWVVPGGRIEVAGWAGAGERVTVKLGRRTIGRATSGRRGHFRVEATAPAPAAIGSPSTQTAGGCERVGCAYDRFGSLRSAT